jgi:hypothetical protein
MEIVTSWVRSWQGFLTGLTACIITPMIDISVWEVTFAIRLWGISCLHHNLLHLILFININIFSFSSFTRTSTFNYNFHIHLLNSDHVHIFIHHLPELPRSHYHLHLHSTSFFFTSALSSTTNSLQLLYQLWLPHPNMFLLIRFLIQHQPSFFTCIYDKLKAFPTYSVTLITHQFWKLRLRLKFWLYFEFPSPRLHISYYTLIVNFIAGWSFELMLSDF